MTEAIRSPSQETVYPLQESAGMHTIHFTGGSHKLQKAHQTDFRTHALAPCSDVLSNSNKNRVLEVQKKGKSSLKGYALLKTSPDKLAKCMVADFKQ